MLVALLVSAVAFSQTPQRKGPPVQTIRGMVIEMCIRDRYAHRVIQLLDGQIVAENINRPLEKKTSSKNETV